MEITKKGVGLKPTADISYAALDDSRWTDETFSEYLRLLNDFYKKTKFRKFYDSHKDLYSYAEQKMDTLLSKLNVEWFKSFYGQSLGEPLVFLSLCNGPSNYALIKAEYRPHYGIVIGTGSDQEGMPIYGRGVLPIVIHELGHNYSNPLAAEYWPQMKDAADKIYPYIAQDMMNIAYGNARTSIGEWQNNLFMLMYYRDNQPDVVDYYAADYQASGFVWMRKSVEFMQNFYNDREKYKTISDFMPELVVFLNETADNFAEIKAESIKNRPHIVNISPSEGSIISTDHKEITITFSEPMYTDGYGFNYYYQGKDINELQVDRPYWKDEYTLILPIQEGSLENDKTYGIVALNFAFRSAKYYLMDRNYTIIVKTAPAE